jgi:dolichyl-phosphate-mannose--protein O-mannosyl transferase
VSDTALQVYFKHVDTGKWLVTSSKQYPRPIAGQYEVACAAKKDSSGAWLAAEGVFFPPSGQQAAAPGPARAENRAQEEL